MGRRYTVGKCTDCEAAFNWKRYRDGRYRPLYSARCPFCRKSLEQTSSQLTRFEWFELDEVPVFSNPSRGVVGDRYGSHHYFTIDIDGQRYRFEKAFSDREFYEMVERLGGYLPRGVHAHHSGTANPRSLASYPLLREEFRSATFAYDVSDPSWRYKDIIFDDDRNYVTHLYDRPIRDVETYLANLISQEVC